MRFTNAVWALAASFGFAHGVHSGNLRDLPGRLRSRDKEGKQQSQLQPFQSAAVLDTPSPFENANTTKLSVNGTGLPEVEFDIGESYAGQLPIGGDSDGNLFFWFFPTTNKDRPKEILIFLNGGPGCSSMTGFMQENCPFQWHECMVEAAKNPWSWHHATNDEDDLAQQFMGFWKNFVDTFGLHHYEVYVTGESHAGMFAPYIAKHFLDANASTPGYFGVRGMLLYNPFIAPMVVHQQIPAVALVNTFRTIFSSTDKTLAILRNASQACGYDAFIAKHLAFPPPESSRLPNPSSRPTAPPTESGSTFAIATRTSSPSQTTPSPTQASASTN
ncbi:Alpha/Beta hydrolase protein [Lasiosphaeria miniovina]|uniref:Alpha/Beta hydrolase protein n=1 Tax=Lasiosphaeria miniovina TaxID=1954250 RepID=A0AA39ZZ88_9PEZI|nr:Alpha/Beta hydrolase protein [Lasiosphaeria miniovina]KAK0706305.1 Alpha/Beta hydrolase protein [Lasiosphaeria miniovina]